MISCSSGTRIDLYVGRMFCILYADLSYYGILYIQYNYNVIEISYRSYFPYTYIYLYWIYLYFLFTFHFSGDMICTLPAH